MGFCESFPSFVYIHKVCKGKNPPNVPFQLKWWPGIIGFAPLDDLFAHAKEISHDLVYHKIDKRISSIALKQIICSANIIYRVGLL